MTVTELRVGEFCTRDNWGDSDTLCIGRGNSGILYYLDCGGIRSRVKDYSTAYSYTDFKLCDNFANYINIKRTPIMKYEEVKILVVSNTRAASKAFVSEDEALDWIADCLEESPRSKFTMFKPYQKVEPKRMSLKELIVKIK